MASGKFNKFLNFIGLVDDEPEMETQTTAYSTGSYGRPSTYIPQRARDAEPRRTSMNSRQSLPQRGSRSNEGGASRRTYGSDDAAQRRQPRRRYDEPRPEAYDERPPRRERDGYAERQNGREREAYAERRPVSRFEDVPQPPQRRPERPAPAARRPARSSGETIVISLVTLRDTNKVITALCGGDTIVVTIESADSALKTRILDTLAGAVYALNATIRQASEMTYVLAPGTVNLQTGADYDEY